MRPVPTQQLQLQQVKKELMTSPNEPPPHTACPGHPAVGVRTKKPGHVPKFVPPPPREQRQAKPGPQASGEQLQTMVEQLKNMGFSVEAPVDPTAMQSAKAGSQTLLAAKSPGMVPSPPNKKPKTELGPTGYPAKARPICRNSGSGVGSSSSKPPSILVDSPNPKVSPPHTTGTSSAQQFFPPAPAGIPRLPGSQHAQLCGVVGQPVLNHFGQPILPTRRPVPTQAVPDLIGLRPPTTAIFPKAQAPMPSQAGPIIFQAAVDQACPQSPAPVHMQSPTHGHTQSPCHPHSPAQSQMQSPGHTQSPGHMQSPGPAMASTPTKSLSGRLLEMNEQWNASGGTQMRAQDYEWLLQLCVAQQVQLNVINKGLNESPFPSTQVTPSPVPCPLPPPPPGPPPPEATYPGEPIPWTNLARANPGQPSVAANQPLGPTAANQHPSQVPPAAPTGANQSRTCDMPQTAPPGKEAVTPDSRAATSGTDAQQRFG